MKLSCVLAAVAAPILAAAAPGGTPTTSTVTVTVTTTATATPVSQCAASAVQCCSSTTTTSSNDPITSLLFGLLNIVIEGLNVPIGIDCSPTSILGDGSTSCNVEPLCCENNTFNGLIAIGCVPIIINL